MTARLREFRRAADERAADLVHRERIARVMSKSNAASETMKVRQFGDWERARRLAGQIKRHVLANLPDLLEEFERNATARGVEVLWAADAGEARALLLGLARRFQIEIAVKSKSMTTEEIELNAALEAAGIEVLESDLGELIVQLAGTRPYHIVGPAIHLTRAEVAELFHRKLGTAPGAGAEELTLAARDLLRRKFAAAGLGITGANFLLADAGAITVVENEGNARLTMAMPRVHVAIAGIEKVLPRLADLALFLPLLASSGTGQQLTCYNTLARGPRTAGEPDGPEHMAVILLDNGRTTLYARPAVRQALRCIRCGACLNVCPVYRSIGGYTYGTVYSGPIGAVITPHLEEQGRWEHLSQASSLCGACSAACPVDIDLHRLLLENRRRATAERKEGWFWAAALRAWAWVFSRRGRLDRLRGVGRLVRAAAPGRARVPRLAPRSFAQMWSDREQS